MLQYLKLSRFLSVHYVVPVFNSIYVVKNKLKVCSSKVETLFKTYLWTIVSHWENFLELSLDFYKGLKVPLVRASRKSNFVKIAVIHFDNLINFLSKIG